MTEEMIEDIVEMDLPFGRRASLKSIKYESGLHMLRLTLRENRRFTVIELDSSSAAELGRHLATWAEASAAK